MKKNSNNTHSRTVKAAPAELESVIIYFDYGPKARTALDIDTRGNLFLGFCEGTLDDPGPTLRPKPVTVAEALRWFVKMEDKSARYEITAMGSIAPVCALAAKALASGRSA